jgi:hypothetical protein
MCLDDKTISGICTCAALRKSRRGSLILCEEGKGINPPSGFEFMAISDGEICVATSLYSTGHVNYDSEVDIEKMKTCLYRRKQEQI